jgi:hypothetical protein
VAQIQLRESVIVIHTLGPDQAGAFAAKALDMGATNAQLQQHHQFVGTVNLIITWPGVDPGRTASSLINLLGFIAHMEGVTFDDLMANPSGH